MKVLTLNENQRVQGEVKGYVVKGDVSDDDARALLDGQGPRELILREFHDRNLITNTAREHIAELIVAESTGTFVVPGWIGLTETAITPTATSTALTGETFRKACSTVATLATYYSRFVTNFTTTEVDGTFLGMGLFASSSGGDLWALVSTSVSKSTTEALIAEWRANVVTA